MKIMHQRFGLVTSLNRPGGNVTGVSFSSNPLNLRRLELLHELVPKTAVIGALMDANFGEAPVRELDAAAPTLGRLTRLN
jgi:putative tryptophan/tyrosine transport system substrate-binding protein